jgi:hypothetical protein
MWGLETLIALNKKAEENAKVKRDVEDKRRDRIDKPKQTNTLLARKGV